MDLPSLALILQAALSPNPDERKAAEQSLNQVSFFNVLNRLIWPFFSWSGTCWIEVINK